VITCKTCQVPLTNRICASQFDGVELINSKKLVLELERGQVFHWPNMAETNYFLCMVQEGCLKREIGSSLELLDYGDAFYTTVQSLSHEKITALTSSKICAFSSASITELCAELPQFVTTIVSENAKSLTPKAEDPAKLPVKLRYLMHLRDRFKKKREPVVSNYLTQKEVGTMLGTSRESISRLQAELTRSEICDFTNKSEIKLVSESKLLHAIADHYFNKSE
jgi:hypothetical protein